MSILRWGLQRRRRGTDLNETQGRCYVEIRKDRSNDYANYSRPRACLTESTSSHSSVSPCTSNMLTPRKLYCFANADLRPRLWGSSYVTTCSPEYANGVLEHSSHSRVNPSRPT